MKKTEDAILCIMDVTDADTACDVYRIFPKTGYVTRMTNAALADDVICVTFQL